MARARPPFIPPAGTARRAVAWLAAVGAGAVVAAAAEPLARPVDALWTALPLRAWGERATQLAGVPVVVDRRLDPDATVTRDCRGEPLGDVLAQVAAAHGAAVEPLAATIRIVPTAIAGGAARAERARAAAIARLPASSRRTLAARAAWRWPDGARPRDLVGAAASDAGVTLAGLDAIPHDHLPAATLPALGLAERLDLVLAHYDLRIDWIREGDASGRIVPLAAGLPDDAGPVAVVARPRQAPRPGPQPPVAAPGAERFTLRLEATFEQALAAIAPRLGLEPELDRASLVARGIQPGEIVRVSLVAATRDELLDAITRPLGLRWRIEAGRLVVDAP